MNDAHCLLGHAVIMLLVTLVLLLSPVAVKKDCLIVGSIFFNYCNNI